MFREAPLAGQPKGHCGCLVASFKLPGHQSALGDRFYRSIHMSQNNEDVEFMFTDRGIDEALYHLYHLGFFSYVPMLEEDLIKKGYIIYELQHFKPIPWLIDIASITEKGRARLQVIEKGESLKSETERFSKPNLYRIDDNDFIYMGFLIFSPQKIEEEILEGRHTRIARYASGNASRMNIEDNLSRIYPQYFSPNSEHKLYKT